MRLSELIQPVTAPANDTGSMRLSDLMSPQQEQPSSNSLQLDRQQFDPPGRLDAQPLEPDTFQGFADTYQSPQAQPPQQVDLQRWRQGINQTVDQTLAQRQQAQQQQAAQDLQRQQWDRYIQGVPQISVGLPEQQAQQFAARNKYYQHQMPPTDKLIPADYNVYGQQLAQQHQQTAPLGVDALTMAGQKAYRVPGRISQGLEFVSALLMSGDPGMDDFNKKWEEYNRKWIGQYESPAATGAAKAVDIGAGLVPMAVATATLGPEAGAAVGFMDSGSQEYDAAQRALIAMGKDPNDPKNLALLKGAVAGANTAATMYVGGGSGGSFIAQTAKQIGVGMGIEATNQMGRMLEDQEPDLDAVLLSGGIMGALHIAMHPMKAVDAFSQWNKLKSQSTPSPIVPPEGTPATPGERPAYPPGAAAPTDISGISPEDLAMLQPQGDQNAVPEQSTGSVLQRQPGKNGGAGGERTGVEPSQQGNEPPGPIIPAEQASTQGPRSQESAQTQAGPEVLSFHPGDKVTVPDMATGGRIDGRVTRVMGRLIEVRKASGRLQIYDAVNATPAGEANEPIPTTREPVIPAAGSDQPSSLGSGDRPQEVRSTEVPSDVSGGTPEGSRPAGQEQEIEQLITPEERAALNEPMPEEAARIDLQRATAPAVENAPQTPQTAQSEPAKPIRKNALNGVIASVGPKNALAELQRRGVELTPEETQYVKDYAAQNKSGHFIEPLNQAIAPEPAGYAEAPQTGQSEPAKALPDEQIGWPSELKQLHGRVKEIEESHNFSAEGDMGQRLRDKAGRLRDQFSAALDKYTEQQAANEGLKKRPEPPSVTLYSGLPIGGLVDAFDELIIKGAKLAGRAGRKAGKTALVALRSLRERDAEIGMRDSPRLGQALTLARQADPIAESLLLRFERQAFGNDPKALDDFYKLGWEYRGRIADMEHKPATGVPRLDPKELGRILSDPKVQAGIKLWNAEYDPLLTDIRQRNRLPMSPNKSKVPFFMNAPSEFSAAEPDAKGINANPAFSTRFTGEGDYIDDPHEGLKAILRGHLRTDATAIIRREIRANEIPKNSVVDPTGKRNPEAFEPAAKGKPYTAKFRGRTENAIPIDLNKDQIEFEWRADKNGEPYKIYPPEMHYVPERVAKAWNTYRQSTDPADTAIDHMLNGFTRLAIIGDFSPHSLRVLFQVAGRMGQSGESKAHLIPWLGSIPATAYRMLQMRKSALGDMMQMFVDSWGSNRAGGYNLREPGTKLTKVLDTPHQLLMHPEYGIDPMARRTVASSFLIENLGLDTVKGVENQVTSGKLSPQDGFKQLSKLLGPPDSIAGGRRVNDTMGYSNRQTRSNLINNLQRWLPFLSSQSGMIPDEIRKMLTLNLSPKAIGLSVSKGQYGRALTQVATQLATGPVGTYMLKQALNRLITGHYMDDNDEGHKTDVGIGNHWYLSNLDPTFDRASRILGLKTQANKEHTNLPADVGRESANEISAMLNPALRFAFMFATQHAPYIKDDGDLIKAKDGWWWPIGMGRKTAEAASGEGDEHKIGEGLASDLLSATTGLRAAKSTTQRNYSPAERAVTETLAKRGQESTPEEKARHQTRMQAVNNLRENPGTTIGPESGVPPEEMGEVYRESYLSPLAYKVKKSDVPDAMDAWNRAAHWEKQELQPILLEKLANKRTIFKDQDERVRLIEQVSGFK